MRIRAFSQAAVVFAAGLWACPAYGVSDYFDTLRFISPLGGAAGTPYTTSQQWDTTTSGVWQGVSPASGDGNFLQPGNPSPLPVPLLEVSGNINETPYFFAGGRISAEMYNYGGTDGGSLPGDRGQTRIYVQVATTTGGTGPASSPTGLGANMVPGSLTVLYNGQSTNTLAAEPVLLDSRPNAVGFGFEFNGQTFTANAEQWLYEFVIPWTGDYSVRFDVQPHTVFEALRVDTLVFAATAPAVPGDYNGDGFVDSADYTVWADHFGQTGSGIQGDGNGDGVVDSADYTVWADHFGQGTPPSGAVAVPEPELAAVLPLIGLLLKRRR